MYTTPVALLYITPRRRPQARAEGTVAGIHRFLFVSHPFASFAASLAVYSGIILAFGTRLEVSGNYFVVLPLIAAALGGGRTLGMAAGALGLPANLLLFSIIGHPEYSPASKVIAEGFGVVLGSSLGYLADYYRELADEIEKLARTEDSLRKALREKELLLKELNHRIKNNLNVIKSLVQLQRNRSSDPAFVAAADELVNRILAISLVHDRLYEGGSLLDNPRDYLQAIAANAASALAAAPTSVSVEVEVGEQALPPEAAVSLGIVANEALTNAMKHGRPGGAVALSLVEEAGEFVLTVRDEGCGVALSAYESEGLGMRIIRALAAQLGGRASLDSGPGPGGEAGGTVLEMRWPSAARSD